MTVGDILDQAGIPLLLAVGCIFYGIYLLIVQDASGISGKYKGPLKNEKEYAKSGGRLILFYGIGTLIMSILLVVNVFAAVGEIILCTLILVVLWKKMSNKYGA